MGFSGQPVTLNWLTRILTCLPRVLYPERLGRPFSRENWGSSESGCSLAMFSAETSRPRPSIARHLPIMLPSTARAMMTVEGGRRVVMKL